MKTYFTAKWSDKSLHTKRSPLTISTFFEYNLSNDINGYDEEGKSAEASTSNIKSDFPLRSFASRR